MNWFREIYIRLIVLTLPTIRAETFAPFINKGRILRVRAVIDLHIHVDFSTIRSQCREVYDSAKLLKISSHSDDSHFRYSAERALLEVERLCKSPIFSLSHHDLLQIHREKRQLGIGLAIGAVASYAVSSLFSSSTHSTKVENHNFKILDKEIQDLQTYDDDDDSTDDNSNNNIIENNVDKEQDDFTYERPDRILCIYKR